MGASLFSLGLLPFLFAPCLLRSRERVVYAAVPHFDERFQNRLRCSPSESPTHISAGEFPRFEKIPYVPLGTSDGARHMSRVQKVISQDILRSIGDPWHNKPQRTNGCPLVHDLVQLRSMKTKKRTSHSDVQLTLFRHGVRGVLDLIEGETVSEFVLRRALRDMKEHAGTSTGVHTDLLKEFEVALKDRGFLRSPVGRPESGDVRGYRVQQGEDVLVVRIPVDYLGVEKGDEVIASFLADSIRLEPA